MMSNSKLQLVTFEQANRLKDLGFDWWETNKHKPRQGDYYEGRRDKEAIDKRTGLSWGEKYERDLRRWEESQLFPVAIAMKWMRDVHNLSGEVYATASGWQWQACKACADLTGGSTFKDSDFGGPNDSGAWDTHEDCEKCCLDELLKIVELRK